MILNSVWKRLSIVNSLVFKASSGTSKGVCNGEGQGSVVVESVDAETILFHEHGIWDEYQQLAIADDLLRPPVIRPGGTSEISRWSPPSGAPPEAV
ncbi:MAG: hypothetical protein KDA91_14250 [Planctomycetaceae bacterium]|nr:hypothetical protein [Planctomycetaceae bacterium]